MFAEKNSAKLAFIGAGHLAKGVISGLIAAGYPAKNIIVSEPNPEQLEKLRQSYGVTAASSNAEAVQAADVVLFAVKPNVMFTVLAELSEVLQAKKCLVVSLAAGLTTKTIAKHLGTELAIMRAMTNTPAEVGSAATGLYSNAQTSTQQHELVQNIFQTIGIVVTVQDEALIDTITVLSSSGPAYIFLLMEALQKAGVAAGLDVEAARLLSLQTTKGAAQLAGHSKNDFATLREQVTTPQGVTARALTTLDPEAFCQRFVKAIADGVTRCQELGADLNR
jgi:pyrroline-5-carboxylate reductase